MRVRVRRSFWVPEYLPVVGNVASRDGFMPDLNVKRGMYTMNII